MDLKGIFILGFLSAFIFYVIFIVLFLKYNLTTLKSYDNFDIENEREVWQKLMRRK